MKIRDKIRSAIELTCNRQYDDAQKLYEEAIHESEDILHESPDNKLAIYCQAVSYYHMSYNSKLDKKQCLIQCLRCCEMYIKGEPNTRHIKVRNLALNAYKTLLNITTGIWIDV